MFNAVVNAGSHVFLLPGNVVCDFIGARTADDRSMTRILANMLVWNLVAAFVALHFA